MKYKLLSILFVSGLFLACTPKTESSSNIDAQISQYLRFMDAKHNPKTDQIKGYYNSLSDILTRAGLKSQADQYMDQVESSEQMSPPLQGVDKTFQQALVLLLHKEIESAQNNPDESAKHIDNAYALYGGIRSTAERRGKYFESDTLFTGIIEESFKNMRNGSDLAGNTQKIYAAIDDVYFLSVLYELEGIAAKRGVDDVIVQEKQIEGSLFYEIIRSSAKNSEASKKIRAEMAKDGNEIDIDLVKQNLKIAFPEKSVLYEKKF